MMTEQNTPQHSRSTTQWNPDKYERAAGFVAGELGADLLDWVDQSTPLAGLRVLDLGCGDGDLSQRLVERKAMVAGVDSSPEMIAAAKARGIDAHVRDARDVDELAANANQGAFDLVFTNATLHWISAKDQVVASVRRILKPGGVFAGEFGGAGCVQYVQDAIRAAYSELGHAGEPGFPWYFIDDTEFRAILEANGFRVRRILMFEKRPVLPEGIVGWLETFGSTIAANLSAPEKQELWRLAQAKLESRLYYDGDWHADYVRLRFEAVLGA